MYTFGGITHSGRVTHICARKTNPPLVKIMACRLVGTKPLSKSMLEYIVNWTLGTKLRWNFKQNPFIFVLEIPFQNVVWKMAAILSRPQCVNYLLIFRSAACKNRGEINIINNNSIFPMKSFFFWFTQTRFTRFCRCGNVAAAGFQRHYPAGKHARFDGSTWHTASLHPSWEVNINRHSDNCISVVYKMPSGTISRMSKMCICRQIFVIWAPAVDDASGRYRLLCSVLNCKTSTGIDADASKGETSPGYFNSKSVFHRPEVRKLLLFYFYFFLTWSWKIIPYLPFFYFIFFLTWSWKIIPYILFYFFSNWSWEIIP